MPPALHSLGAAVRVDGSEREPYDLRIAQFLLYQLRLRFPDPAVAFAGQAASGARVWCLQPNAHERWHVAVSHAAFHSHDLPMIMLSLGSAEWLSVLPRLPERALIVRTIGPARPYDVVHDCIR